MRARDASSSRRACSTAAGELSVRRRLARGDAGRLLRHRHGRHVGGRPGQLQLPAAVRVGHARRPADARHAFVLGGGVEYSQWDQRPGEGHRAVGRGGLHAGRRCRDSARRSPTCTRTGTAAIDWRTSAGYSRRGGYYGVTFNNFTDADDVYSFRQVDYEAIQHVPLGRDAWVLSLHGAGRRPPTQGRRPGVPFFMLPALGGGSSLRGFTSWRFRDMQQPAAAGRVARPGQQLLRHGASSTTPARSRRARSDLDFERPEERLRHRVPPARSGGDAAAHRARQGQRGPRPRLRGQRVVLRRLTMTSIDRSRPPPRRARLLAPLAVGVLLVAAGAVGRAPPSRSSTRTIPSPRARDRRRVRRAAVGHRPLLRPHLQPVRDAAARCRRSVQGAERQHDRRGAGFELVHQPHRQPRR